MASWYSAFSLRSPHLARGADPRGDRGAALGLELVQLGLERGQPVGGDVVGGVVGHGSAVVVVDDLDVVPVGVQDERAVVAGVVDGALAGPAVVRVARGERGGVEGAHGRVIGRGEREVHVLRERPLVVDQREAEALAL